MIDLTKALAALAFGLAVAAHAGPVLAHGGEHAHSAHRNDARDARAQALENSPAEPAMDAEREKAIRECSAAMQGYSQTTWGDTQEHIYRTCMNGRGQME